LERDLRGAIAARGVPVEVYPPVAQQDVSRVLAGATAALVPSRWPENAPMAIVEAAAQGVPSIATDVGGIPELVESERDGLLVAPRNPQGLARSMVRLAHDPLLAHRLGEQARNRALRDHDPTRYVAGLELIYANARRTSSFVEASSRTETVSSPSIGGDS
jgi:glycosyltransferase involved in cell wall biosynthesis